MGDKDKDLGQRDAYKWRGAAPEGDQPPSDEAEAEGHGIRGNFKGSPDTDQPPSDEAEGHGVSRNH